MSATPATTALDRAGIGYRLHAYDHDPANRHFGDEAAAALGVDTLRIFKTLIVDTGAGGGARGGGGGGGRDGRATGGAATRSDQRRSPTTARSGS
jgi:hypothetical protein